MVLSAVKGRVLKDLTPLSPFSSLQSQPEFSFQPKHNSLAQQSTDGSRSSSQSAFEPTQGFRRHSEPQQLKKSKGCSQSQEAPQFRPFKEANVPHDFSYTWPEAQPFSDQSRQLANFIHASQQLQFIMNAQAQAVPQANQEELNPFSRMHASACSAPLPTSSGGAYLSTAPRLGTVHRPQAALHLATAKGRLPPFAAAAQGPPRPSPELLESIKMLQQAQQLSAQASSYIEAFSRNATGSCGSKRGKRKLAEMSQALTRRLGDLLTEGQQYVTHSTKHKCSLCGTTYTPTWRRGPNKALVCNACGLRGRRSSASLADMSKSNGDRPKCSSPAASAELPPSLTVASSTNLAARPAEAPPAVATAPEVAPLVATPAA